MGVLEDAIREHLDLKRQHGASEEEVVRQETEALGQARRAPAAEEAEAGQAVAEPAEDEAALLDAARGEPAEGEPLQQAAAGAVPLSEPPPPPFEGEPGASEAAAEPLDEPPSDPYAAPPASDPYAAEPTAPDTAESEPVAAPPPSDDVFGEEPGAGEPADAGNEPFDHRLEDDPARDDTALLDDPVAFDELEPGVAPPMPAQPEQPPASEGDAADEDVLEETPDFLQETPEHDRLWFEQKPPRDFDFD